MEHEDKGRKLSEEGDERKKSLISKREKCLQLVHLFQISDIEERNAYMATRKGSIMTTIALSSLSKAFHLLYAINMLAGDLEEHRKNNPNLALSYPGTD